MSQARVRREGGKFVLYAHEGRKMGTYDTMREALERQTQIYYQMRVKKD